MIGALAERSCGAYEPFACSRMAPAALWGAFVASCALPAGRKAAYIALRLGSLSGR